MQSSSTIGASHEHTGADLEKRVTRGSSQVVLPSYFQRIRKEVNGSSLVAECLAEFFGTFIYVWAGASSYASFYVSTVGDKSGLGDLQTVGFAYALGITFGIIAAGPISGSHLSPAMTIVLAALRGFPLRKVPHFIISQILGAFIACLVVYLSYKKDLQLIYKAMSLGGDGLVFSSTGPASVLALFPTAGQNMSLVFWNELVATTFLGFVIFTLLDVKNAFVHAAVVPVYIGCAYAVAIWGSAIETVVLNTARDLGGRMAAAAIFGPGAFTHNPRYTALAAFTNIIGTFLGAGLHALLQYAKPTAYIAPSSQQVHAHVNITSRRSGETGNTADLPSSIVEHR